MLRTLKAEERLGDTTCKRLQPAGKSPLKCHGLHEIHKTTPPLGLVSCRGEVTYGVVKELTNIIRPLVGHSPHHIRNTQTFVDHVKSIRFGEGKCITPYAVKALFTSVPVGPANSIIRHNLEKETQLHLRTSVSMQHIITLLEFCLKTPISSSKVRIMNRCEGKPWDSQSAKLWPTCS